MHKHSGRVLSWLHHLSLAELRMAYLKKVYTVCVSTYQMAVLLAYNQQAEHSTASLARITQLPDHELASTIQSLLDSKLLESIEQAVTGGQEEGRVPTRDGGTGGGTGKEKGERRTLKLNMGYTNKRTKFKITAMLQKESQQVITKCVAEVCQM